MIYIYKYIHSYIYIYIYLRMRMFFTPLPRMPFIETRMPTARDFYESLLPTIWEREILQHYTFFCTQITMNHPKSSKTSKTISIITNN